MVISLSPSVRNSNDMNLENQKNNSLLIIYFLINSIALICCFFATILPYWYAKYPSESTNFLSIGLWEICLNNFVLQSQQQKVYNGCFYLFDSKISSLWPFIFTGWLHATQGMQVVVLTSSILAVGICLAMMLNVADRNKPNIVIFSLLLLGFIGWLTLTTLGLFGISTDLAKKRLTPKNPSAWIAATEQCSLSWCYGLAGFSLLFTLIAINILTWCVYPRKEPGGRLTKYAWGWPSSEEAPPCCLPSSHSASFANFNHVETDNRCWATPNYYYQQGNTVQSERGISSSRPQRAQLPERQKSLPAGKFTDFVEEDFLSAPVVNYDPRSMDPDSIVTYADIQTNDGNQPTSLNFNQHFEADIDEWSDIRQDPRRYHDPSVSLSSRLSTARSTITSNTQAARSMHAPRRSGRSLISASSSNIGSTKNASKSGSIRSKDQANPEKPKMVSKPIIPNRY